MSVWAKVGAVLALIVIVVVIEMIGSGPRPPGGPA